MASCVSEETEKTDLFYDFSCVCVLYIYIIFVVCWLVKPLFVDRISVCVSRLCWFEFNESRL